MRATLGWAHDVVTSQPRVRLHLRRPAAEVRRRRRRRDRPRPRGARRAPGPRRHRRRCAGDRLARTGGRGHPRRSASRPSSTTRRTSSRRTPASWPRSSGPAPTDPFDGYVAVGGGSAIDTAKAVDLLLSDGGDLMDYVNAPVGDGRAPTQPLAPLVAVPTTTGTGAESTTICVLDVLALKVKTGISHVRLRPSLAVVDPRLTATQPAGVTASAGMDILCHALESWTARPFTSYERKQPGERVPYCGSNPISDMWSERSMSLLAKAFRTRRSRRRRRGRPRRHGARGDVRGPRVRQRRRPRAARQRLPHRRPGARLPPGRLPRRRADGAARHGGRADRARGVPLDVRVRPRSGTSPLPACSTPATETAGTPTRATCCPASSST